MKYTSDAVKAYHFKYGSSRYYTTLVTLLPDGTRFEWSRNEEGLIYFSWEEGKRVTFFRLMQEFGMDYAIRESFKIVTDYNVWDSSSLLEEAKKLLETKKQFVETPFISYLYDGMELTKSADQKQLKIDWKGLPIEIKYVTEKVQKDLDQRDTNFLTPFLGALVAQYLLELKPADCETDGQNKLTWCAKRLIHNSPATLLFAQYSELTDEMAQAFSKSDCQSLYLNGLRELPLKTAEALSGFKGRLFLDGLNSISKDSLTALLKHAGRYLSMRGLILDPEEIKKAATQYDGFLRLGKKTDTKRAGDYTKEELEASILSDKKKFASLSKLLTSDTKDQIDVGLLMFSALIDAPAADALLEGISYFKDDNSGVLVLNSRFKTTLKRQPLLNYALMGVIYHAPADSKIANRLRTEVDHLQVDLSDLTYLGAFPELRVLELTNSLKDLTSLNGVGECPKLAEIDISGCEAISNIEDLSNLPISRFRFAGCTKLASLSPLQGKADTSGMAELNLCKFEELTSLEGAEFFSALETLYLNDNTKLVNAAALSKLPRLKLVQTESAGYSITLPSLVGLDGLLNSHMNVFRFKIDRWSFESGRIYPNVTNFRIECKGMTSLDWLSAFPNLKRLSVECPDLSSLEGIEQAPHIEELLLFEGCFESIDPLGSLKCLQKIELRNCSRLKTLDILTSLPKLTDVHLVACPVLEDISGWTSSEAMKGKKSLDLYRLSALQNLGNLSALTNITSAYLQGSFSSTVLRQLRQLSNLSEIRVLQTEINVAESGDPLPFHIEIKGVKSLLLTGNSMRKFTLLEAEITDLSGIAGLTELEHLVIIKANDLTSLRGLESLKNLISLHIETAHRLTDVNALAACTKLSQLTLRDCRSLKDVNAVGGLNELRGIDLRDTKELTIKPAAYQMNADQVLSYQQKILKTTGAISTTSVKEKKSKLKDERAGTVDKKAFSNIKKLLQSRDLGQIDTAIQLIASINEAPLFDMLLEGTTCVDGKIVLNKIFDGTGPAQPFLNYGLLHVLSLAAAFDHWKSLCEEVLEWDTELAKLGPLNQFTNLKKASLRGFDRVEQLLQIPSLKDLNIASASLSSELLSGCTGLEALSLSSIHLTNGIVGISAMTQLKKLSLGFSSTDLSTLAPLAQCTELEKISITGPYKTNLSLSNLSPFSNLSKLRQINLQYVSVLDTMALSPMSWLKELSISNNNTIVELHIPDQAKELTHLSIQRCSKLKKVICSTWPETGLYLRLEDCGIEETPPFTGAKSFNSVSLTGCDELRKLDSFEPIETIPGLSSWRNTRQFNLNGCPKLEDISGIRRIPFDELILTTANIPHAGDFSMLKRLTVPKLESLAGIAQFSGITQLNLYGNEVVSDLSIVRELPNLERLTLRGCKSLTSLEGIQHCKNLKHLNLADTEKLSDISALEGMMIEELFINGCLLKKSDFPAHLQDFIDWQTKPD